MNGNREKQDVTTSTSTFNAGVNFSGRPKKTSPQIMERQSDRSIHFTPGFLNSQLLVTALHPPAKKAGAGRIYVLCSHVFTRTSGRKELVCVPQHPPTDAVCAAFLSGLHWNNSRNYNLGQVAAAQLVQRWTEKPGTVLVQLLVQQELSPPPPLASLPPPPHRLPTPSQLSVQTLPQHLLVQPPSATACSNICTQVQNPKHRQPHYWLDAGKYCAHR